MPEASLSSDEFVRAFTAHGRLLWVIAAASAGRADADDLVQETARVAWQRRAQFVPGSDLRAWLAQIARHLAANWRRRRRAELRPPDDLTEFAAAPVRLLRWSLDADHHELPDELAGALATLSEVARTCLLLHVVLGLSFAEVATMLDICENTAASHARRARQTLRDALAAPTIVGTPAIELP